MFKARQAEIDAEEQLRADASLGAALRAAIESSDALTVRRRDGRVTATLAGGEMSNLDTRNLARALAPFIDELGHRLLAALPVVEDAADHRGEER